MREIKYKTSPRFFYTDFASVKRKNGERLMGQWVKPEAAESREFFEIGRCLNLWLSPYLAFPRSPLTWRG
jgi:hypothetical protein